MKQLTLILAIVLVAHLSQAQISKGKVFIGGNVGFGSNNSSSSSSNNPSDKGGGYSSDLSIAPKVGYFLNEHLAVGLGLGFNYSYRESNASRDTSYSTKYETTNAGFNVSSFVRYYLTPKSGKFYFFFQATISTNFGTQTESKNTVSGVTTTGSGKPNPTNVSIALSPNMAYFINDHWSIELGFRGLTYSYFNGYDYNVFIGDKRSSHGFDFGINSLSPNIGVQFFF